MRKLPPLNALRAFEAAGRHLSLTRAADELHVTTGAVSQQIKTLEEYLGVALFRRLNRRLLLTDAGQICLPQLSEGLDQLMAAVESVQEKDSRTPLTVSVAPSFGSKWLVPRLGRFQNEFPDVDIRIDASAQLVDLKHDDIDIGIRFGRGKYPGMQIDCLFTQEVLPVCSPTLLKGEHPLLKLEDLHWHALLHNDTPVPDPTWPDWQMWLTAAGVKDVDPHRGLRFIQQDLLAQAVLEGQGVALLGSITVADDLASGRLIMPFDLSFPTSFSYYVVITEAKAKRPRVNAFRKWLLKEASLTEVSPGTVPCGGPD